MLTCVCVCVRACMRTCVRTFMHTCMCVHDSSVFASSPEYSRDIKDGRVSHGTLPRHWEGRQQYQAGDAGYRMSHSFPRLQQEQPAREKQPGMKQSLYLLKCLSLYINLSLSLYLTSQSFTLYVSVSLYKSIPFSISHISIFHSLCLCLFI